MIATMRKMRLLRIRDVDRILPELDGHDPLYEVETCFLSLS